MDAFEILLRGLAAGVTLTTGIGFLRSARPGAARWSGALFSLSVAAFAVHSGGSETRSLGPVFGSIAWSLAVGGTAYFWAFGVSLFEDRRLDLSLFAPAAVMSMIGAIGALAPYGPAGGVWIVHNLLEVVLVAHVALVIWRGWRGDLVEARRSLRGPFMLVVAVYTVMLSGFEVAELLGFRPPWGGPLQAASLALLSLVGAATFLQARPVLFESPARNLSDAPDLDAVPAQDRPTLAKLEALMTGDEVWRREGLTVGQLAAKVGTTEHRLRRLINGALGFRNFADFLNARRIEAARAMLADPANARTPVSAIAFDLGYASLGPFNRAFKDATGLTPTAWRGQALGGSPEL